MNNFFYFFKIKMHNRLKNNMFSVILSLESKIEELKAERGVDNK